MSEFKTNTAYITQSVQSLSPIWLFATPWTAARQAFLTIIKSRSLLKLVPIESVVPTISSSVIPFSSCLQSFPAPGSFLMSWFFTSGGQSIGASDSASFLPMKIQSWFTLGWTGWSPCSPRHSQQSCLAPQFESISSSELSLLYGPILIHMWLLEKP